MTEMLLVAVEDPTIVVGRRLPVACVLYSATVREPVHEPPPRHSARL